MNFFELLDAIKNTLLVTIVCTLIALPIGTTLSLIILRTNAIGRNWAWPAVFSQIALPLYVFAGGWSAGFGLQGWVSALTQIDAVAIASMQSRWATLAAVGLVHALAAIPWVALITSIGLQRMDRSLEETALLESGTWGVLRRVVLPALRPWLLASFLWCCVPIATEMVITNLYQVPTVAEQIYLDASRGNTEPLTYLAAVLCCVAPILLGTGLFLKSLPTWSQVQSSQPYFAASLLPLGNARVVVSVILWMLSAALVGLPILNLLVKAGWQANVQTIAGGSPSTSYGWSVQRLVRTAIESSTLFNAEFYWSTVLALASTFVALTLAALLFAFQAKTFRMLVNFAMVLMIATPGPMVGMLVIWLLNRNSPAFLGELYDHTLAAPVLAQQFRLMPFAWLLVHAIAASIPRETRELMQLDSLDWFGKLRYVWLPLTWKHWLAASLILAVFSIGELSCTILVLPPGVTTLSMRLFEMLHFGMRHQDSGLCGVLMLLGWAVAGVLWKTRRER